MTGLIDWRDGCLPLMVSTGMEGGFKSCIQALV